VEYVNRLLGALLGFLLLIQFIWAIKLFWKSNRRIVWLSTVILLLTGFQGWLGKRVVDANLATAKITTHMIVALLIAALALAIIYLQSSNKNTGNKKLSNISLLALALLTIQIILGTAVREQIDVISKQLDYGGRQYWVGQLNAMFYIHRSFSLLVAAACIYTFIQFKKAGLHLFSSRLLIFCVAGEIVLGITLAYFDMPAFAQPLHLLFSSLLFVALFNNWLHSSAAVNSRNV
jgi:cytochrome c oxidase assembly protein subunit 15